MVPATLLFTGCYIKSSERLWGKIFWKSVIKIFFPPFTFDKPPPAGYMLRLFPSFALPLIWHADGHTVTLSYLKNKQSRRSLQACFCPAFHFGNKQPSVLKEGQATPCYVRLGNVVRLLICCKFALRHAWSFNKARLCLYQEGKKHLTWILQQETSS